jgi:hypothetical protein
MSSLLLRTTGAACCIRWQKWALTLLGFECIKKACGSPSSAQNDDFDFLLLLLQSICLRRKGERSSGNCTCT